MAQVRNKMRCLGMRRIEKDGKGAPALADIGCGWIPRDRASAPRIPRELGAIDSLPLRGSSTAAPADPGNDGVKNR